MSTFAHPVAVTFTVKSTAEVSQTSTPVLTQFQTVAVHVGLRGVKGDKGDKGDTGNVHPSMPMMLAGAEDARDLAVTSAGQAVGARDQSQLLKEQTELAAAQALESRDSAQDAAALATQKAQEAADSAAAVNPDLLVPRTGNVSLTGHIEVPANAQGGEVPQAQEVALLASSVLGGLRNLIRNGNFSVNQDGVSGVVTLAAGKYGHDGWKAGAAGCSYTFAEANGVTTLTITAGTLIQHIDGEAILPGKHTLNWTGTSLGKIGAGPASVQPVTTDQAGGADLIIEFATGTLSLVQFEPGSRPTLFERRPYALEMSLCEEWYERTYAPGEAVGSTSDAGNTFTFRAGAVGSTQQSTMRFRTIKRAVPTIRVFNPVTGAENSVRDRSGSNMAVSVATATRTSSAGLNGAFSASAVYSFHIVADARP